MPRLARTLPPLLLLVCALCVSEARADTFVVTSGSTSVTNADGGLFTFGGAGMSLTGRLVNGPSPDIVPAGQTLNLLTRNVGLDIVFGTGVVGGVTHTPLFYEGTIDFNAVLPNVNGPLGAFTMTVPFTITGQLRGCLNNSAMQGPCNGGYVFDTLLSGQGLAFIELFGFDLGLGGGRHFFINRVTYDFDAVPEPATLILLGSGLAGVAAARRKRSRQ